MMKEKSYDLQRKMEQTKDKIHKTNQIIEKLYQTEDNSDNDGQYDPSDKIILEQKLQELK